MRLAPLLLGLAMATSCTAVLGLDDKSFDRGDGGAANASSAITTGTSAGGFGGAGGTTSSSGGCDCVVLPNAARPVAALFDGAKCSGVWNQDYGIVIEAVEPSPPCVCDCPIVAAGQCAPWLQLSAQADCKIPGASEGVDNSCSGTIHSGYQYGELSAQMLVLPACGAPSAAKAPFAPASIQLCAPAGGECDGGACSDSLPVGARLCYQADPGSDCAIGFDSLATATTYSDTRACDPSGCDCLPLCTVSATISANQLTCKSNGGAALDGCVQLPPGTAFIDATAESACESGPPATETMPGMFVGVSVLCCLPSS